MTIKILGIYDILLWIMILLNYIKILSFNTYELHKYDKTNSW